MKIFSWIPFFRKRDAADDGPEVDICRGLHLGYTARPTTIALLRMERDHRKAHHAELEMFRRHS
jgi:hypothetical protein